jgi:hypothetical protein
MFDSQVIREQISQALQPVRETLAPNVLLRIHPDTVQGLAVTDDKGDILILLPAERTIDNDRTFGSNHQTRTQKVLVSISLPNYYQATGAGKVAERVQERLEKLKVKGSLFDLTFENRREFFLQKRWVLELTFDIVGRQRLIEDEPGTIPQIASIGVTIL